MVSCTVWFLGYVGCSVCFGFCVAGISEKGEGGGGREGEVWVEDSLSLVLFGLLVLSYGVGGAPGLLF